MKTSKIRGLGALAVVGLLVGVAGCPRTGTGGGPRPSTPPTFVLAWTDPAGAVNTLESPDGTTWLNGQVHASATSVNGPGVGHDRNLTWLLVWPTRVGLALKVGIGGVPTGGQPGGVLWDQSVSPGPAVNPIVGRPSVAFLRDRWYIAYRTVGGGIEVVRSRPNSVTSWDPPNPIVYPTGGLVSRADPALTYYDGVLALAFLQSPFTIAVTFSFDGISWTGPNSIGSSESFGPGITYGDGVLLANTTYIAPGPQLSGLRFQVSRMQNDGTWSPLGEGGNWDQQLSVPATAAYGNGRLLLARRTSTNSADVEVWVGQADSAANPTSIAFPLPPQGIRPGARSGPYGVSVAFGSSTP
jgi:hypothetical protein